VGLMHEPRGRAIVDGMTPLVKALLALALVVPLVAYVAGTLSTSGAGAPEQQGTVYLDDAEPVGDTGTGSPQDDKGDKRDKGGNEKDQRDDRPGPTTPSRDAGGSDDREARVVTPAPVGRDDDDDERDDDRDDTDDGGDTDD
jgi:hypothetical protein